VDVRSRISAITGDRQIGTGGIEIVQEKLDRYYISLNHQCLTIKTERVRGGGG